MDTIGLWAFFSLDDVEIDPIAFPQGLVAFGLDGTEVTEDIRSILSAKKAVALSVVEPLHQT